MNGCCIKWTLYTLLFFFIKNFSTSKNVYRKMIENFIKSYVKILCSQILDISLVFPFCIKKTRPSENDNVTIQTNANLFCKFECHISYCGKMISYWIEFDHCYFSEEVLTVYARGLLYKSMCHICYQFIMHFTPYTCIYM